MAIEYQENRIEGEPVAAVLPTEAPDGAYKKHPGFWHFLQDILTWVKEALLAVTNSWKKWKGEKTMQSQGELVHHTSALEIEMRETKKDADVPSKRSRKNQQNIIPIDERGTMLSPGMELSPSPITVISSLGVKRGKMLPGLQKNKAGKWRLPESIANFFKKFLSLFKTNHPTTRAQTPMDHDDQIEEKMPGEDPILLTPHENNLWQILLAKYQTHKPEKYRQMKLASGTVTLRQLKTVYIDLCRCLHPDKELNEEKKAVLTKAFIELQDCYEPLVTACIDQKNRCVSLSAIIELQEQIKAERTERAAVEAQLQAERTAREAERATAAAQLQAERAAREAERTAREAERAAKEAAEAEIAAMTAQIKQLKDQLKKATQTAPARIADGVYSSAAGQNHAIPTVASTTHRGMRTAHADQPARSSTSTMLPFFKHTDYRPSDEAAQLLSTKPSINCLTKNLE